MRISDWSSDVCSSDLRPGGLRTGSPSSPPPRSIRPTVRRLPRSPRFTCCPKLGCSTAEGRSGPGPRRSPSLRRGRHREEAFDFCDGLELGQVFLAMLRQPTDDPRVAKELADVALGERTSTSLKYSQ